MSAKQQRSVIMWEPCLVTLVVLMEGRTKEGKRNWGKGQRQEGKLEDNEKEKQNRLASSHCLGLAQFTLIG